MIYIKFKIIGIITTVLLLSTFVKAQQTPLFSSYIYNPLILSPSYVGSMDQVGQTARLMLAHRYQFAGFEGAPNTSLLALDAPFAKQNMGLGGMLYSDVMGLVRQTGFQLAYSYKLKLSDKTTWHLGLAANIGQQSLNMDAVNAYDMTEAILNTESAQKMYANGTFGTHIEISKFQLGLTIQQIGKSQMLYQNYQSNVNFNYDQPAHFIGFASYKIDTKNGNYGLIPILSARYTQAAQLQYDVILKGHIKNKVYITAGYRSNYALSFGAGAVLNNSITLSYTYDAMVNEASVYAGGGHEFTLGYRFFKGAKSPSNFEERPSNTLTQEQVDSLFEQNIHNIKLKMDSLDQENNGNKDQIIQLNIKVDSLESDLEKLQKAAASVKVNNGFVDNTVQFGSESAKLTEASKTELNSIAAYLKLNSEQSVIIEGYADNTGSSAGNLLLSKMRATAVYEYLLAKGISAERMQTAGFGEEKPVADNSREEGRVKNRRVEIIIK